MALSSRFVESHIPTWTARLASSDRAYRKQWPSRLFHHSPLENALVILRDGYLRSRNDPYCARVRDVAAPGVISNAVDAHDRVRLYFRPRTPTQFHIEGIRKNEECQYGSNSHAPMLVMFVLDAKSVFSLGEVMFSDRNMQRNDKLTGSDEEFFLTIPFDKVYHDSGIGGDISIISHRCAEVLPNTPLVLSSCLKEICFRSEPERDTLLHQLGSERIVWEKYCRVSEELKVFDKRYAFVSELRLSADGVTFRINGRHDSKPVDLKIEGWDDLGVKRIEFHNSNIGTINESSGRWIFRTPLGPSNYFIRIHLEGQLACECHISLLQSLI